VKTSKANGIEVFGLPIGLPGLLVEQEQEKVKVETGASASTSVSNGINTGVNHHGHNTAPKRRTARTVSRSSVTNMNHNRSTAIPASNVSVKTRTKTRTVAAARSNQCQANPIRGGDNGAQIGFHNEGDCAPVRMTQPRWNRNENGNRNGSGSNNNRVGSVVQKNGNLNGSGNVLNNGVRRHATVNNSSKRRTQQTSSSYSSTLNSQKNGKQVADLLNDGIRFRSKQSSATQTQRVRLLQDREFRPMTNANTNTNNNESSNHHHHHHHHEDVDTPPPPPVALPKYKAFILDNTYASTQMLAMGGSRLGGFVKSDYDKIENISLPEKAVRISEALKNIEIDGIIATGGDGSLEKISGLLDHMKYIVDVETGERVKPIPFVGIPKTIDNDIPSTIYSLGFQSAVSRAATAIAEARNTAESHRRIMVVECMGRDAGFLTLHAGMAGGADTILLPEFYMDEEALLITSLRFITRMVMPSSL